MGQQEIANAFKVSQRRRHQHQLRHQKSFRGAGFLTFLPATVASR
jgi:hypothetical protein